MDSLTIYRRALHRCVPLFHFNGKLSLIRYQRIHQWDSDDPEDRSKWYTQHRGTIQLDEPYVYHTVSKWLKVISGRLLTTYKRRGDKEQLEVNVLKAISTPLAERFIRKPTLSLLTDVKASRMATEAVTERHKILIQTDWRLKAENLLNSSVRMVNQVFLF